jgi:hypothetical protein
MLCRLVLVVEVQRPMMATLTTFVSVVANTTFALDF